MESRDRDAQALSDPAPNDPAPSDPTGRDPALTWRLRLVAWSVALTALAFVQAPGRVVTDTKLDLVVDPWSFLGRATGAWDPNGALGQLQNQAYGYLFPMGPFFGLGHSLGLDPWVVQRLWWSLVMVVAFLGAVKLAGLLGVRAPWVRIVVGLLYALSPRMMSVIGASSIEVWPSAVAPWVLIPLVVASTSGRVRTGAALSALAVACVGGVNAAATFAVVPLAAWWILTRPAGRVRRRLMLWWPVCVLMATLWWIVPLVVLGAYSPPFLDLIESASNASLAATAFDALRGTSNWVPYVDGNADAGRRLVSEPVLIANGVAVLALGVVALARRGTPHRRFLVGGVLIGLLAVTAGHASELSGWGAGTIGDLLDGTLAPLRNTHKFDLVLRLPLVLGAGLLLQHLLDARERDDADSGAAARLVGVSVLALAAVWGATVPAWSASLAPERSFVEIPPYWEETTDWLADHPHGATLLAPASPFGDYLWGRTGDEPLQPLAESPWIVRNLVPLTPTGTIEQLDAFSDQFLTGQGSPALADTLRRAGIGTIVVRNDLALSSDVPNPELARATLASTPGIDRVAEFGPLVGGPPTLEGQAGETLFVEHGWQTTRSAVEVFQLDASVPDERRIDLDTAPTVIGDAGTLATLDRFGFDVMGLPTGLDVVLVDPDDPSSVTEGPVVLTDGQRSQETKIGAVFNQRSATLTDGEPFQADRRIHGYHEGSPFQTVARLVGAERISSSSSQSDVDAFPFPRSDRGTWAAFDGDPTTLWSADPGSRDTEAWVELEIGERRDVGTASITADLASDERLDLVVTTEQGDRTVTVQGRQPTEVEVGTVARVRVSGPSSGERPLHLVDVTLSGVDVSRPLVLPTPPESLADPSAILLSRDVPVGTGCLVFEDVTQCRPGSQVRGDEGSLLDRVVALREPQQLDAHLEVAAVGGPELDRLVQSGLPIEATVSSRASDAPQAGAASLIDGDEGTGWSADPDDPAPTVTVRWAAPQEVSAVDLETGALAAATPLSARIELSDGSVHDVEVEDGRATFPASQATWVRVTLGSATETTSVNHDGSLETLPIGLVEIGVPGVTGGGISPSLEARAYECGSGPTIVVGERLVQSRLVTSPSDLLSGRAVGVELCDPAPIELTAGENRVQVTGAGAVEATALLLDATGGEAGASASSGAATDALVRTHNTNTGWTATQDGRALTPLVLNGWQQGWVLDGDAPVSTSFSPQLPFRAGLAGGAVALLALVGLTVLWRRRERPVEVPEAASTEQAGYVGWVVLVAVAGLLGGWVGVALAVGGALAGFVSWRGTSAGPAVAAGAVVAGGVAYLVRPWGDPAGWAGVEAFPQACVLVLIGAVLAPWLRRRRWTRSMTGFSTSR
ncbi:alpha-(1-_3)-arabinofuranosyltransferase family protein [Aeromicrobium sp. Leaf350]|uniref:alpha-(1->3)-arabinofuranosyltransferase domain-containing protein n=1 Tax=Aeromicrobium sp. Leaf350 TaxID=2876565 RepID=UPI001E3C8B65|nr:alpha-(1->3)-arabinofuranosyltransferase family protein [Aeromicrobium sp. Leaf350]